MVTWPLDTNITAVIREEVRGRTRGGGSHNLVIYKVGLYQTHSHRTAASGYSQDPRPFWLHGQNLRAWGPDKSSWSWIYRINIGFPYAPVLLCLVLWHGFLDSAVHRLPLAWTTPVKPPLSRTAALSLMKTYNDCHVPITMNLGSERASGSDSGRSKSLTNQFASHKSCRESTCRAAAVPHRS